MKPALPAATNLEQLRKQAKDLLRAHRSGNPAATARVAAAHPSPPNEPKLADAQLVVAREYGFPSWPKLKAYVQRAAEHGPGLRHAFEDRVDYYAERAGGLLASAKDGTADAVAAFERWSAPLTEAGARSVLAREHGFTTWAALQRHVGTLATSGSRSTGPSRRSRSGTWWRSASSSTGSPSWSRRPGPTATTCSGWPAGPVTSGWWRY